MKFPVRVIMFAVPIALLVACAPAAQDDPAVEAMHAAAETSSQMSAAIATVIKAWDSGNTDALDAIMSSGLRRTAPDKNADSLDDYKALIAAVHTIYPDFHITNDGVAVGPDSGFVQWTVTGTDSGAEDATGNSMQTTGITRYQFEDGKIVSEFVVFDTGSVLTQLQRETLPHGTE